jgi:site-specific DNA recombinase
VAAIAGADKPSPSLTERLGQLEESAGVIDRRLGEIDGEVHAVEQSSIDPEHVAATLAEFTELWDVLYPQEKTRIVHLLVERVIYGGDHGSIQLVFHTDGLGNLDAEPQGTSP